MKTKLVYFDESGDDGNNTDSSKFFVLTSTSIDSENWKDTYNRILAFRKELREEFGLHIKEEFHSKNFFYDKDPYRKYNWSYNQRNEIAKRYIKFISSLDINVVNVVIQKENITTDEYGVLEKALTYNIQRIDNDSNYEYKYLVITDEGRTPTMRKTARKICVFNSIQSKYNNCTYNEPIKNMIEDILEKDSKESYFIQISDMIATVVGMYFNYYKAKNPLPKRLANVIDRTFIGSAMATFKKGGILNLKASSSNKYGIVCYPK